MLDGTLKSFTQQQPERFSKTYLNFQIKTTTLLSILICLRFMPRKSHKVFYFSFVRFMIARNRIVISNK